MTALSTVLPRFSLASTTPALDMGRLQRDAITAVSAFLLAGGAALAVAALSRVVAFS